MKLDLEIYKIIHLRGHLKSYFFDIRVLDFAPQPPNSGGRTVKSPPLAHSLAPSDDAGSLVLGDLGGFHVANETFQTTSKPGFFGDRDWN